MSGPKGLARHDDYAGHRCPCGHLVYADETPGGSCRFCPCTDHTAPLATAAEQAGVDGCEL